MNNRITSWFTPNACVSAHDMTVISLFWGLMAFLFWQFAPIPYLPRPFETVEAIGEIWSLGIATHLGTSIKTMATALACTILITLTLAYAAVFPALYPIVRFLTGLRSWGFVGLTLFFTLLAPNSFILKVMLLTFGITVFFLRDMLSIVTSIAKEQYDHAEVMGFSKTKVVYEVVILGTLNQTMKSLQVNGAMGWMMLTGVEAVNRNAGGIGMVLSNSNRHMDLSHVAALLFILFVIGQIQDFLVGFIRELICPYAVTGKTH